MSDIDRVMDAFQRGLLLHPRADVPGAVDLAQALASLCGGPDTVLSGGARQIAAAIGDTEHLVFVLVDGLGLDLVETLPADAFLRRHVVRALRTVYPSSTAPALTSLATGMWPAAHAVPGWWTWLPDAGLSSTILPFVERTTGRPLDRLGVRASYAFPAPAWMGRASRDVASLLPRAIAGSVYSHYFGGDRTSVGYRSLAQAIDMVAARVASAARPAFTYLYLPFVDQAEHDHGPQAPEVRQVLRRVDAELARLAALLDGSARLAVSADHGQIEITPPSRHILGAQDPLLALLRIPPTGEPRAPIFHVRPGIEAQFERHFRERLGGHFALLTLDEAMALELFGPPPQEAEARRRLGNYVGIAMTEHALLYEPRPELQAMRGFHGGMTPEEMRVPLIVV